VAAPREGDVRFRGPRKQRLAGPWHRPSGPCHPALAPVTHLYSRPTRKRLHQEPPASPAPPSLPAGEEGGAGGRGGQQGRRTVGGNAHANPADESGSETTCPRDQPMNLEVRQLHVTCPRDHPRFNGRVNVPIGSDGREMTRILKFQLFFCGKKEI